jgi:hypothetical protein
MHADMYGTAGRNEATRDAHGGPGIASPLVQLAWLDMLHIAELRVDGVEVNSLTPIAPEETAPTATCSSRLGLNPHLVYSNVSCITS